MEYSISLGKYNSEDCVLCINDKEYAIESNAWNLIAIIRNHSNKNTQSNMEHQRLLSYIYYSFDEDLHIPVDTVKSTEKVDQPKKRFPCEGIYKYPGACGLEQECTCS